MRFLLKIVVSAFALWLTTLIVTGVSVVPYEDTEFATVLTYLLIAFIFGIVNATVGTLIRIVGFPLYVLTLVKSAAKGGPKEARIDMENSGLAPVTDARMEEFTSTVPTSCQMKRP